MIGNVRISGPAADDSITDPTLGPLGQALAAFLAACDGASGEDEARLDYLTELLSRPGVAADVAQEFHCLLADLRAARRRAE